MCQGLVLDLSLPPSPLPPSSVAGREPQEERLVGNTIWYIKSV